MGKKALAQRSATFHVRLDTARTDDTFGRSFALWILAVRRLIERTHRHKTRKGTPMLKRTLRRYAKTLCVMAVLIGTLSLNGCFFIGGHGGHHGWHHHDHWDRW
jgi:hypothetical protein